MVSGSRIRNVRKALGMSQAALADRVGVTQSHISELENNQNSPSAVLLQKLADVLDVPVDALFGRGEK